MWPFSKSLESVLNRTKKIRVFGVKFEIKKIDPTNFLDGSKSMIQSYDTYKTGKNLDPEISQSLLEKIRDHYKDVFLASIVNPKLRRNDKTPDGLLVDNLFTDWDLAHQLYSEIMELTYGKKKLKQHTSQKTNS